MWRLGLAVVARCVGYEGGDWIADLVVDPKES
jgi:hypothetical protein